MESEFHDFIQFIMVNVVDCILFVADV